MRFGIFITIISALLIPLVSSAQSVDGSLGNTNPFTISAAPQYPSPMSPVTLTFLSSSLDLTNATMTVSVGGKQAYQGSVRALPVMLGKAGKVTNVLVKITSAGASYSQSLTLQPEDVVLIAEPLSSSPVLYPGKSLVPQEGNTRIVAMANFADATGKFIDPASLSYAWTVEGVRIANSSGIGKSAVIVASPLQYRDRVVSVIVQSQAGTLVGGASLSLAPQEPSVRIYENDPLLGIRFEHALSTTYAITGTEASLYAAPFSFSLTSGAPLLQWFLGGTAAQTGNLITLRPSGSGQGNASLSLTASVGATITAVQNLTLSFGAKPSSNIFGL